MYYRCENKIGGNPLINPRKQIRTYILESQDLFQDIFMPVNKRHGFIKSKSPNIPIYFYRYIGTCENKEIYYDSLHELNDKLASLQNLYLNFTSGIPVEILTNPITQVPWSGLLTSNSIERNALLSNLKTKGLLPNFKNSFFNDYILNSFDETTAIYLENEPNITETVIKNFAIKFLGWIGQFTPKLFGNSNYDLREEKDIINPKVLFFGEIKKHEINRIEYGNIVVYFIIVPFQ